METVKISKTDLIKQIADTTGFRQVDIEEVLGAFVNAVGDFMAEGYAVPVKNLGTFVPFMGKDKKVCNGVDGKTYLCHARMTPKFKVSKTLYNKVAYRDKTQSEMISVLDNGD